MRCDLIWCSTVTLIAKSEVLPRHFIATFGPIYKLLKPLLLQVKPVMTLVENVESLRNNYVFNPLNDGDKMGLYSNSAVSCLVFVIFCAWYLLFFYNLVSSKIFSRMGHPSSRCACAYVHVCIHVISFPPVLSYLILSSLSSL